MDNNTESNNGSGTTLFGEKNNNDGTLTNGPTWSTDFPGNVPTLSSSNPVDDETDTPYDTNITLTFSEIIKVGTGNITLKKTSDDSVVEIFDVTTDVSGSGTTQISINPSSDLEIGVEYYVLIDSTAIVDLSRNSYAGISSTTELSFSTGSRNSNPFDDKDILALVEAQTAAPKKVVSHVTTPIFNRLNWIRGYESNENLSAQSIKFNFLNPKLSKIANIVPVSAKNNKIPKRYNQDWLFWSEGSVSVGRVGDSASSSSKDVNTNAITLGWDKKIDDKLIHGYTITHTQDDVEVGSLGTSVDTDSYSLSTYATFNKNKNRYLESIIGVSKLDLKNIRKSGSNTLTGAREGKQIFGSLQYLNTFKKNQINISPNVKVDFSYTTLAAYTETGTSAIKYDEQQVETVGLYGGFDFNNEIIKSNYTLRPLAGLQLGLDLSPSSDVSLNYVSDPNTKHTKSIDQQDEESIKGKIGFDILTNTGWSFMTFYERNQSENSHSDSLYFLTGYVSSKEEEYAMALNDNKISLEYKKNTKGFDIKFGSNYNLMSQIPDYSATIEFSNKF
jgi:methionine-rich copper-binding protein CopC